MIYGGRRCGKSYIIQKVEWDRTMKKITDWFIYKQIDKFLDHSVDKERCRSRVYPHGYRDRQCSRRKNLKVFKGYKLCEMHIEKFKEGLKL